jgi:hypothetical protein
MFPFALVALLLYTVTIPVCMFLFMRRNKAAIKTDQILRVQGLGDDRMSNPNYYTFRQSYSKLYYHFKPGRWYWELVIYARKAALSFTSLMFRSTPSYQLAMALLVLFAAYVLHMRALPYITHGGKEQVLADHQRKALTDKFHATIEAEMRATEQRNTRKRRRTNVLDVKTTKKSVATAALLSFFDYNVAEAILLASALLTVLAGIMFDSGRFTGGNLQNNLAEYNSLAGAVIALVIATMIYFLLVFFMDICFVLCPRRAATMFALCGRAEDATLKKLGKAGAMKSGGAGKLAPVGISIPSSDEGMSVNPILLRHGGMQDDLAGESGVLDPVHVSAMPAPTEHMWAEVQASYNKLATMVSELRNEVRNSKRAAAEVVSATSDETVKLNYEKTRRQFEPVEASINPLAQRSKMLAGFAQPSVAKGVRSRDVGPSIRGTPRKAARRAPIALEAITPDGTDSTRPV